MKKNDFEKGLPIFELIDGFNNIISSEEKWSKYIDITFGFDDIDYTLADFLQNDVMPDYFMSIDRSHSTEHVLSVIKSSLLLSDKIGLNKNIILTAAVYHDLWRLQSLDCEKLNYISTIMIMGYDKETLLNYFSEEEILLISDAIIELGETDKSNEYSKVLSDSDILLDIIDIDHLIKRYCNYVVVNNTFEPVNKMVDILYKMIHNRYKNKKSIGNVYYTKTAQDIYNKNIDKLLEVVNSKKVFVKRLKKLVDEEFNKKS